MIVCTQQQFEQKLQQLQMDKPSGLSGPFIHSAPKGNMYRAPFKEYAWTIKNRVVLQKNWNQKDGWTFLSSDENDEG